MDSVGYAYVKPAFRRRRKKAGGGTGVIAAVVAVAVVGACVWGWQASRPAETAPSTDAPAPTVRPAPSLGQITVPRGTPPSETSEAPHAVVVVPRPRPTPSMHVSAEELIRAIATDRQQADATYAGRMIAVDGRADAVGRSLFGTPAITLGAGNGALDRRLECTFSADDAADLNAIKSGDAVTLIGKYEGGNATAAQLVGCRVAPRP